MKKFAIILFLMYQGSAWSDGCNEGYQGASVTSPKSSGEIVKGRTFQLLWTDVDRILGESVNIRLHSKDENNRDNLGKPGLKNRPNSGGAIITKRDLKNSKIVAGEEYYFKVSGKGKKKAFITSACFTFKARDSKSLECGGKELNLRQCVEAQDQSIANLSRQIDELRNEIEHLEDKAVEMAARASGEREVQTVSPSGLSGGKAKLCEPGDPYPSLGHGFKKCRWNGGEAFRISAELGSLHQSKNACWAAGVEFGTKDNPWLVGKGAHKDYWDYRDKFKQCAENETCYGIHSSPFAKDKWPSHRTLRYANRGFWALVKEAPPSLNWCQELRDAIKNGTFIDGEDDKSCAIYDGRIMESKYAGATLFLWSGKNAIAACECTQRYGGC